MICKNCGQGLTDDMRFCTNCGSPIEMVPHVSPDYNAVHFSTIDIIPNYKIIQSIGVVYATWAEIAANRSGLFEAIDAISGN